MYDRVIKVFHRKFYKDKKCTYVSTGDRYTCQNGAIIQ